MKECPYCHTMNADDATGCRKCMAGFPAKILPESTNENSADTNNSGSTPRKKRNRGEK